MKTTNTQKPLGFSALVPCSIFAAGAAILAYQGYFWFVQGYWKPLKTWLLLNKVLPVNFFEWLRSGNWPTLNRAINYTSNLPLAWFLMISGLLLLLLTAKVLSFHYTTDVEAAEGEHWRQ